MKYLLTSGGIKNPSIQNALLEMLDKPIKESNALCIPTALYGHPGVGPGHVWRFIAGQSPSPMSNLGWQSLGVLELTALPSIDKERWVQWIEETVVLLVTGGDALYLCYWMKQSGLVEIMPSFHEKVWVGVSAGSMVMTPCIGEEFVNWRSPSGNDNTLGLVDFSIFPHLNYFPSNTLAKAEQWASKLEVPGYAIDEDTAIKVVEGEVEVVSEGQWKLFTS